MTLPTTLAAGAFDPSDISIALLAIPVGIFIGLCIGAFVLRIATSWATKISLHFGRACLIVVVAGVANWLINLAIAFAIGPNAATPTTHPSLQSGQLLLALLSLPISFIVSALIYGSMIKYPQNNFSIGFAKGALITFFMFLIGIGITVAIFFAFFAYLAATGVHFGQ